jgi:4-hydroxy-tetrahydrodipicolinate synthase
MAAHAQILRCARQVRPPSRVLPEALREQIAVLISEWREGGWL